METGPNPGHWRVGQFEVEEFRPRRGLRGGHRQTIAANVLPRPNRLPAGERRLVQVEDGVQVLCVCHWQAERSAVPTAVLVHGLEGSSDSHYVVGLATKAWEAGWNAVRMNVRNCGGTEELAPTLYHSGMSADIGEVVRHLIATDSLGRVVLAGYSMGGNQALKLAGEWGADKPTELAAVAAVSPAMDLSLSADALHRWENRLYEWRFLLSLRRRMRRKAELFPDKFRFNRSWWRSIRHFDDDVTAPHCGYQGAEDYYGQASSSRVLDQIAVPTLVLHAADDPFIRVAPETCRKLESNPWIRYVETAHGGHCGFLAASSAGDGYWAERQVMHFFRAMLSPPSGPPAPVRSSAG